MAGDVAGRLKEYAKGHAETIGKEYAAQIGKWTAYLNLVADQQIAAENHFQDTLRKIKEEEAKAEQYAMVALSLVGMAACAWIGALVELKVYPQLAKKVILSDGFKAGKYWVKSKEEFNEIAAKFFGDTVHEVLGHVLDKTFELVMPEPHPPEMNDAFWNAILGSQLGSFRSNLMNGLLAASKTVTNQLTNLSENINHRQDFGDAVLREVDKRFPAPKNMNRDKWDQLRETNGMNLLDEYFDKLRQRYAKDWFYYGNNPSPGRLPILSFHIELEIWAIWLVAQEWKFDHYRDYADDFGYYPGARFWTNGDFHLEDIMEALDDLAGEEVVKEFWSGHSNQDELAVSSKLSNAAKSGGIDADEARGDLSKMLDWANSIPGKVLHGNLDYRPRVLGNIGNISSVTADN
jgi:hypothetical protein